MSGGNLRRIAEEIVSMNRDYAAVFGPPGEKPGCLVLAEAWLADHPADDHEPVTADWLRSVGGVDSRVAGRVLLVHPDDPGFVVAVAFDGAEAVNWSIVRSC